MSRSDRVVLLLADFQVASAQQQQQLFTVTALRTPRRLQRRPIHFRKQVNARFAYLPIYVNCT